MTLEFEKLAPDVEKMAEQAARLYQARQALSRQIQAALRAAATDWPAIRLALQLAEEQADPKYYRAARPLDEIEPLDAAVDPSAPPPWATIIATDGSQIMPDRHAAFLYSLVNIGVFIYTHGESEAPIIESRSEIFYPKDEDEDPDIDLPLNPNAVTVRRDLREIEVLAETAWAERHSDWPRLALLDQRLLYWPFGGQEASAERAVLAWSEQMTKLRDAGAFLAGYIDSPGKRSVVTLLQAVTAGPDFDWSSLGRRSASADLTDAALFASVLRPGQRSKVFVDVSPANRRFAEYDPENEVCFFYLNTSLADEGLDLTAEPDPDRATIARVDIPMWVARQPEAVAVVHALLWDQCQVLGDYPYVLARADELAVVGQRDESELNILIDLAMQRQGVPGGLTAKQQSKTLARAGKTRHAGHGRMGG